MLKRKLKKLAEKTTDKVKDFSKESAQKQLDKLTDAAKDLGKKSLESAKDMGKKAEDVTKRLVRKEVPVFHQPDGTVLLEEHAFNDMIGQMLNLQHQLAQQQALNEVQIQVEDNAAPVLMAAPEAQGLPAVAVPEQEQLEQQEQQLQQEQQAFQPHLEHKEDEEERIIAEQVSNKSQVRI